MNVLRLMFEIWIEPFKNFSNQPVLQSSRIIGRILGVSTAVSLYLLMAFPKWFKVNELVVILILLCLCLYMFTIVASGLIYEEMIDLTRSRNLLKTSDPVAFWASMFIYCLFGIFIFVVMAFMVKDSNLVKMLLENKLSFIYTIAFWV